MNRAQYGPSRAQYGPETTVANGGRFPIKGGSAIHQDMEFSTVSLRAAGRAGQAAVRGVQLAPVHQNAIAIVHLALSHSHIHSTWL